MTEVRGIVLAGTYHWLESSLEELLPRPLLPVAQNPLICYSLGWLRDGDVVRATICTNSASRAVRAALADGGGIGMGLDYYEDWTPRGAAGCVRDAGLATDGEVFVIVDGTSIPAVDLQQVLAAHTSLDAGLTVVAHATRRNGGSRRPLSPAGIYIFDRRVLQHINSTGFQDLKENLIPKLHRCGERVVVFTGAGACPRVLSGESYMAVNHWLVERIVANCAQPAQGYQRVGSALVHESADVDDRAVLAGPVIVGPSVQIGAGAAIVGPTSIGPESQVAPGAFVARSVLWSDCVVEEDAMVDRCAFTFGVSAGRGSQWFNTIKTGLRSSERPATSAARQIRPSRPRPISLMPLPVHSFGGSAVYDGI